MKYSKIGNWKKNSSEKKRKLEDSITFKGWCESLILPTAFSDSNKYLKFRVNGIWDVMYQSQ